MSLKKVPSGHVDITLRESITTYSKLPHAAHCLLYFVGENKRSGLHGQNEVDQQVCFGLMQMRSDGRVGFPGGCIDERIDPDGKGVLDGLNRELLEEINYTQEPINHANYVCSHHRLGKHNLGNHEHGREMILHFYAKRMTEDQIKQVESTHTNGRDFPEESLGLFRIPVFWTERVDGTKNFDLTNNRQFWSDFHKFPFAGNSFKQLLFALQKEQIIDETFMRTLNIAN